jgi:hypothetical protein
VWPARQSKAATQSHFLDQARDILGTSFCLLHSYKIHKQNFTARLLITNK